MSLRNLTVGTKLLLGFMSIALMVAVMGYTGVNGTRQISRSFDDAANSSVPAIQALGEIKLTAKDIGARIAVYPLIGDEPSEAEAADINDQKNALIGKVGTIVRWAERYERAVTASGGDVRSTFGQNVKHAEEDVILNAFKLLGLKERGISGKDLEARAEKLNEAQDRLEAVIGKAIDDELAHIEENNDSVSSAADTTRTVNIVVSVLTFAFAAAAGLVFARSIGVPIRRLKDSVERFGIGQAGGSARVPVGSGDEIRQLSRAFDHMTLRLQETTVSRDALEHELVERQRVERALTAENAFRRAIENSARAGILAIDLEGTLIYANPSFCDMVGWSEDEVLGASPPFSWWPPEETDTIGAFLQDILVGKAPADGTELRFQRRNGEQFDVFVLVAPLKGDDDQTTGWLASSYDITDRKRAASQIAAALEEKEVLLSEIHHRVKNNMEIVSSLLDLQAADLVDEPALRVLRSSQTRIRSMALIHEKFYQSEDLAKVDFGEYVRTLVADLYNLYGVNPDAIELKIDIDHIFLGIDSAIPSGLIINELVSNSLKHAFPADRDGEINISFRPDDDGRYGLTVGDNGVGLPETLDFRNTNSLGLRLVHALTAQLKGAIEVDRSGGTEFKITFEAA